MDFLLSLIGLFFKEGNTTPLLVSVLTLMLLLSIYLWVLKPMKKKLEDAHAEVLMAMSIVSEIKRSLKDTDYAHKELDNRLDSLSQELSKVSGMLSIIGISTGRLK